MECESKECPWWTRAVVGILALLGAAVASSYALSIFFGHVHYLYFRVEEFGQCFDPTAPRELPRRLGATTSYFVWVLVAVLFAKWCFLPRKNILT